MDDRYAPRPVAGWFTIAAIASLLFMAVGCAFYIMHVTADPASLPLDQRRAYEAVPAWAIGAFGVATWGGAVGALLLVLKRKAAEPVLLLALVATIVWLVAFFAVPELSDAVSTNDLAVPVIVTLITGTIWSFARRSRQRGWLR